MNYRKAGFLGKVISALGALLLFAALNFFGENRNFQLASTVIAWAMIIAGFLIMFVFDRCPHCRGLWPVRGFSAGNICCHCRKELN